MLALTERAVHWSEKLVVKALAEDRPIINLMRQHTPISESFDRY